MDIGRIQKFFDKFVSDFSSFNGDLIATRYSAPYTAIDSEGGITLYVAQSDIAASFQGFLDGYSKQGIKACNYRDLDLVELGAKCVCATVTWEMLDEGGQVVLCWRESYNILDSENTLKVFTSIDH